VHRAGICGTDVGVMHGYVPGKFPLTVAMSFQDHREIGSLH